MTTRAANRRRIMALTMAALVLAAIGLIAFRSTPPAVAETGPVVANWQMNEGAGAATMIDSSGNGIDGAIGDDVTTGGGYYEFPSIENGPANEPYNPERIVQVGPGRALVGHIKRIKRRFPCLAVEDDRAFDELLAGLRS